MQILKTCGAACVITQSWIDLHRSIATMAAHSLELLEWNDRYRYQQCLLALIKGFCRVMHRMNQSPTTITLLWSSRPHEALPLQKRNAELVAIITANLATISPVPRQVWLDAEGVCLREGRPLMSSCTDSCARSLHLMPSEHFNARGPILPPLRGK